MDTQAFIRQHREDDIHRLALTLPQGENARFILRQIEGWQRLRHKVPTWAETDDLRYPVRLSLEQCSGEEAAKYKQAIVHRVLPEGGAFADLTGGFGVDFAFMAQHFKRAVYVERDTELCALARHNMPLVGANHTEVVQAEAEVFLRTPQAAGRWSLIFLDPARRDSRGRKVSALSDCSPDVATLWPVLTEKADHVMLKLSPMLDITEALRLLAGIAEIHVIGSSGECKELLLLSTPSPTLEPTVFCHDSTFDFSFLRSEEQAANPVYAAALAQYLYDPAPVVLKAGALRLCATRYGLQKLAPHTHLYTSDRLRTDFPGRIFRILRTTGCSKRDIASLKNTRANLTLRNFPDTVETLRKKWHLYEGGNLFLFACRNADQATPGLFNAKTLIQAKRIQP